MLTALVADLAVIDGHQVVATVDTRFPLAAPVGVDVVTLDPMKRPHGALDASIVGSGDFHVIAISSAVVARAHTL
jgi:hypothetical protein